MPGPSIKNVAQQERAASAGSRTVYFLTDPYCTEIHGVEVTDHIRQNGLMLTESEAMALVAAGAVTTDRVAAEKAVAEMKASHEALTAKREEATEAARLASAEDDAATAHNLGVAAPATEPGKPAKPGDGSLTASQVDNHMQTLPENGAAGTTWAAGQAEQA